MKIQNLGKAITILAKNEALEHILHADVDIMGAPGECHGLVSNGEEKRLSAAIAEAEQIAGASLRAIEEAAKQRGGVDIMSGDPAWQRLVGRIYEKHWPF
jgi:RecB family endonuclease NucS